MKQYLAVGQEVIFVDHDGKEQEGTITAVYSEDSAYISLPNGSAAIANLSEEGDKGTFHFGEASTKEEQPQKEAEEQ